MTQIKELEQQISNNLQKIRVMTLKRFLYCLWKGDLSKIGVASRRAKHDYKLAEETLMLIQAQEDAIINELLAMNTDKMSEQEKIEHLGKLELCAKIRGK